jgi:hypothetical protein
VKRAVVAAMIVLVVAACGADGSDVAGPGSVDPASPTAPPSSTARSTSTAASVPIGGDELEGITGALVLTRQRDLLDRGLVNVMIDNASDRDLLVADRRLDADHFEVASTATRATRIGAGRTVALQTPFGVAVECADDAPVTARLVFTDGDLVRRLDLTGTDILDALRAEQCVGRAMADAAEVELRDVRVVDGTVDATLHATLDAARVDPQMSFEIGRASGTILVAARRHDEAPVVLDAEHPVVETGVTFTVNRCDPHAVAEVTKPYGLDLEVSLDGGEPVTVAVDVRAVEDELVAIVEECRAAATE